MNERAQSDAGTETEYAVSVRQDPHANPVQSSFDVIAHTGDEETGIFVGTTGQEDPVHDMRGMTMPRAAARPDMLPTNRNAISRTPSQPMEGACTWIMRIPNTPRRRRAIRLRPWPMISPAICLCVKAAQSASTERHQFEVFRNNAVARALRGGAMRIICCVAMWTSM